MKLALRSILRLCLIAVVLAVASCSVLANPKTTLNPKRQASDSTTPLKVPTSNSNAPDYKITDLADVSFVDNQVGFGLFVHTQSNGIGDSCSLSVSRTTDGGLNFSDNRLLGMQSCYKASIAFGSGSVGIVYGPGLEVTDNDGSSWFDTKFSNVMSAAVANKSIWVLWGNCSLFVKSSASNKMACNLSYSSDGGINWSKRFFVPNEGTGVSASQIVSASNNTVYLLERPGSGTSGLLYSTVDNGATWRQLSSPNCIGSFGDYLSVGFDSSIWVACANEPGAGNQIKSVTVSSDGGISWLTCASTPSSFNFNGPWCTALGTGGYLGGIFGVTANMAVIYGGRNSLWITSDAGATFGSVNSPPTMAGTMVDGGSGGVYFINVNDGWAIADPTGSSSLWHTTDGGKSWHQI